MAVDYQKLADEQALAMGVSPMPVYEKNVGSAATDQKQIYVDPQFASSLYSSAGVNGIRFVLAHELGHARGGAGGGHAGELAADRWAAQSLARKGIGFTAIRGVMSMLPSASSSTHPDRESRAGAASAAWSNEYSPEAMDFKRPKRPR